MNPRARDRHCTVLPGCPFVAFPGATPRRRDRTKRRRPRLLEPRDGHGAAVKIALGLYAGYNLAAAVIAIPGGRLSDRRGSVLVLCLAAVAFVGSFAGRALVGASIPMIALLFALGAIGIGLAETTQSAAIATHSAPELRGSAFGLVSPTAAFLYLAAWSAVALLAWLAGLAGERRGTRAA